MKGEKISAKMKSMPYIRGEDLKPRDKTKIRFICWRGKSGVSRRERLRRRFGKKVLIGNIIDIWRRERKRDSRGKRSV